MNSKDLLSINEAFAKASSKVTADEPAKKDEVVTEGSKDDPLGVGKTSELSGATRDVKTDKEKRKEKKKEDKEDKKKKKDKVEESEDVVDETAEESELDDIMDNYENMLSKNFGVKPVKEKATGEGFKKPDEKVSEVDSKTQRPKGEVNPEEKSKDVGGAKEDLQEPVEASEDKAEKKPKNEKKLAKESINNCNKGNIMSEDKSIFDKLYESVMGEGDDFELGIPGDDAPGDPGDEFGDEGGDEVTVTLTPDQAAALKAVVDQLPSDDEDPGDDIGADDPLADTDELEDSVHEDHTPTTGAPTSDGKAPGKDPSDGGGKTTDPAPDSLGGKSAGTGDAKVTDDEATTGKPTSDGKKPGDPKHGKPGSQAV